MLNFLGYSSARIPSRFDIPIYTQDKKDLTAAILEKSYKIDLIAFLPEEIQIMILSTLDQFSLSNVAKVNSCGYRLARWVTDRRCQKIERAFDRVFSKNTFAAPRKSLMTLISESHRLETKSNYEPFSEKFETKLRKSSSSIDQLRDYVQSVLRENLSEQEACLFLKKIEEVQYSALVDIGILDCAICQGYGSDVIQLLLRFVWPEQKVLNTIYDNMSMALAKNETDKVRHYLAFWPIAIEAVGFLCYVMDYGEIRKIRDFLANQLMPLLYPHEEWKSETLRIERMINLLKHS